MTIEIAGVAIRSIAIIDDDAGARTALGFRVEDLGAHPVHEDGPIRSLDALADSITRKAQAAIFDQHLRKKNYSHYNGAEATSYMYKNNFPAVLCTNWEKIDLTEIRQYRRQIPVLLRPNEINTDSIVHAFELCINEFKGKFSPARKPWRTLVRIVDEGNSQWLSVIIPAWDSETTISLHSSTVPPLVFDRAKPGMRLFAQANIGTSTTDEIYIDNWEL